MMKFSKYHGIGNDFLVIDFRDISNKIDACEVRRLCDRNRGVGADGIVGVHEAKGQEADLRFEIHNADGSIASTCGNGLRCFAWHVFRVFPEYRDRKRLAIETRVGNRTASLLSSEGYRSTIRVDMGRPQLDASEVPVREPLPITGRIIQEMLEVGDRVMPVSALSMGNPHAVVFDPDASSLFMDYAPKLATHEAFPKGANAGFASISPEGSISLSVWELGVGPTLACGSGACAAAMAAVLRGLMNADRPIDIHLPGGPLKIDIMPDHSRVYLEGEAEYVFEGVVDLGSAHQSK